MVRAGDETRGRLRWQPTDVPDVQPTLFSPPDERVRHPEFADLEFIHVRAKRIINEVPAAARVPFRYTINVYRGCSHGCSYCFARPTHTYLNLDAGRDFERVIVVKVNAVEALRAELSPRRWAGEHIAMGTNTDPYQRCEGRYRLTRGVIETLAAAANPFSILTKSPLVLRDLDVLSEVGGSTQFSVNFSIGTLDHEVWRATEPGTPRPESRVEAVARLREAGIHSGVLIAPIIPAISDRPDQLEAVVKACIDAGATNITPIVLHLRPGVKEQFLPWLEIHRPDLLRHYERLYPRAYASKDTQQRISRLVADLVARYRGTRTSAGAARRVPEPKGDPARPLRDRTKEGAAAGPLASQLNLGV